MTFGSVAADAAFGLACAVLLGAFLDHRKRRWTGRRRQDGATPRTDAGTGYGTPGYRGGMKQPRRSP